MRCPPEPVLHTAKREAARTQRRQKSGDDMNDQETQEKTEDFGSLENTEGSGSSAKPEDAGAPEKTEDFGQILAEFEQEAPAKRNDPAVGQKVSGSILSIGEEWV